MEQNSVIPDPEQLRALVEALPDPVFIITESGRYADLVGGKDSRFYHDGSVLIGKHLHDVLPRAKADWFLEQIHTTLTHNQLHTVEYDLGGAEVEGLDLNQGPSHSIWFEGRIQPLASSYNGERAVVWVARNITRRHELEEKLRRLSQVDSLTGLFNRRKLLDELADRFMEFQRYQYPNTFMMMDIDYFKQVNDTYGHIDGDDVLHQIAELFREQMRDIDIIARFGGEEFAILLPSTDLERACISAERLRQTVAAHEFTLSEKRIQLTLSIGLSQFLSDDADYEAIIRRADKALYQAKHDGRNRVVCRRDS